MAGHADWNHADWNPPPPAPMTSFRLIDGTLVVYIGMVNIQKKKGPCRPVEFMGQGPLPASHCCFVPQCVGKVDTFLKVSDLCTKLIPHRGLSAEVLLVSLLEL